METRILKNLPPSRYDEIVDADWGQEPAPHPVLDLDTAFLGHNQPFPDLRSRIELSATFKTSFLYSFRKAWLSALLLLIVCTLLVVSELTATNEVGGYRGSMVELAEHMLLLFHCGFLLLEVFYWECYRRRVRFFIQNQRFHVKRGLFRRFESSAPLVGATEFFISQSPCDAFLGLYSLLVLTPLSPANGAPRFTRIDGLTRGSAEGLLEWLARYVKHQESKPPSGQVTADRATPGRERRPRSEAIFGELEW